MSPIEIDPLLVEEREEHRAGVDGLPDSAGGGRHVEDLGVAGIAFDVGDAAAHDRRDRWIASGSRRAWRSRGES